MAQMVKPAPKFTHPEWTISNQTKYANAEAERAAAERLVDESKRLVEETKKTTMKVQRDVDKKLEQRLDDIKYWKQELDDKLDGIKKEIDALSVYHSRIDKQIQSLKEPLHIAQQCLLNRQKRRGIDLVHDDADRELMKEVEVLQGALALLERTREQATEQLRLNRKAKYNLEKDHKDKFAAEAIDGECRELRDHTPGIHMKQSAVKIDGNSVTVDAWQDFSNKNILEAEKQRNNSVNLRSMMDGILQATAHDSQRQKEATDVALERRIFETRDSKEKLEDHLKHVLGQITEMEDNIDRLQKAIAEKEAPMKLAQTRLDNRSSRPHVELCRDTAQYRLVEEVQIIDTNVARLQERLAQSQSSLRALVRRQLDLEEDIAIKANTLFIDETECMGMRKSISLNVF